MANGKIISIDGMGGDHAPRIVVEGLELFAQRRADLQFLLHGDEAQLKALLANAPTAAPRTTVRHTDKTISMDAKPAEAVRRGKGSSMWNAIEAVKNGEAIAAVSAGNTGALMGLATLVLRTLPGIDRPAIAAVLPTSKRPVVVLDLGANVDCSDDNLVQFAVMGEVFSRVILDVAKPRVALLNIGTEEDRKSVV